MPAFVEPFWATCGSLALLKRRSFRSSVLVSLNSLSDECHGWHRLALLGRKVWLQARCPPAAIECNCRAFVSRWLT
jgi:hypothetical protein